MQSVLVVRSAGLDGSIIGGFLEAMYHVNFAETAKELDDYLNQRDYELILIDSTLSDMDNVSAIKLIRSYNFTPYVIVRAETDDEIDRILALELGADDCVAISCGFRELKARLRAFHRRNSNEANTTTLTSARPNLRSTSRLTFSGWILDKDRCELLSPSGEVIDLTQAEYLILSALFSDPDAIKDRHSLTSLNDDTEQIYNDRSLDVFVSRIRKKITRIAAQDLIQTVRGKGYRLIARPAGLPLRE